MGIRHGDQSCGLEASLSRTRSACTGSDDEGTVLCLSVQQPDLSLVGNHLLGMHLTTRIHPPRLRARRVRVLSRHNSAHGQRAQKLDLFQEICDTVRLNTRAEQNTPFLICRKSMCEIDK